MADVKRKDVSMALNIFASCYFRWSHFTQRLSELHVGIFQLQQDTEKAAGQTIRFVWNWQLTSLIPADQKACGANELHSQLENLLEKLSWDRHSAYLCCPLPPCDSWEEKGKPLPLSVKAGDFFTFFRMEKYVVWYCWTQIPNLPCYFHPSCVSSSWSRLDAESHKCQI